VCFCHYRIERRLTLLAAWSVQDPDAIHAAIWGSGFEGEAERGLVSADAPDEMLYLDDDATYVAGARQAGLSAHQVDGASGVRASLALHGLECV
jgi:hypothetical protein